MGFNKQDKKLLESILFEPIIVLANDDQKWIHHIQQLCELYRSVEGQKLKGNGMDQDWT